MAKNKKDEKIVEKEPIVIDEKSVISDEELSNDKVIDVEAPEIIVENSDDDVKTDEPKMPEFKKLICKSSFTDKFDKTTVYKIGDELNITDIVRRNDLIKRGLAVEE